MPNITTTGTYTKQMQGFSFLESAGGRNRTLLFAGNLNGATVTLQYTDDAGVDRILENGTISVLPKSIEVGLLAVDLKIVVATANPNPLNVTSGGIDEVGS